MYYQQEKMDIKTKYPGRAFRGMESAGEECPDPANGDRGIFNYTN